MGMEKTEKKLQENEELMKRLTGIWEDKWSKTQKIIEVSRWKFHCSYWFLFLYFYLLFLYINNKIEMAIAL